MKKIDCFGEICPIPLLKLQKEMKIMKKNDQIFMVVDHSCVIESVRDYLKTKNDFEFEIDEVMNGVWEITVKKTNKTL